jgi:cytochrome d ubiquinol oxidase subunit I
MSSFILARILFASTITFHILFPTINIALAWVLLYFNHKFNKTKDKVWDEAYSLWVKIFAISFTFGAVSGIFMSFQFGTNWPGYMKTVGNIAGPLLSYEVMTAFFLEATFLGIMLFARSKVSKLLHSISILIVSIGVTLSGFWILTLNSWMQSPRGFIMIDGVAHVKSWFEIIFNPTMPYTVTHMFLACLITVAFLLIGISTFQLLINKNYKSATVIRNLGIKMAVILVPSQILFGDLVGLNAYKNQPAKVAALEANWETSKAVPTVLFAWPDEKMKKNHYAIEIPKLKSILLTHDSNGEVKGLNEFKNNHPPVKPVFFAFRIMVGTGFLMLFLSLISYVYVYRKKQFPFFINIGLIGMTFSGWIATISGWYVAEIGRQPYLVYGLLKTKDAVSSTSTGILASTLSTVLILYGVSLILFIYTIFKMSKSAAKNSGGD